jgi:hypothetical protein
MKFQILVAMKMKVAVFWYAAQCSLVDIKRQFKDYHDEGGSNLL